MLAPKNIPLTASFRSSGHTAALADGRVGIEGVDLELIEVKPQIAAFRRMVRNLEFDICELAPTTYFIAKAHGAPFTALPIFFSRRFHHAGLVVQPDSDITHPRDLEGRKVGVRAYSVTTGVWTRGIIANEYGVDTSKVTWVVDDEEHVTALKLPPNVVHVEPGKTLAGMMAARELDAGFTANAGIGREGPPQADWGATDSGEKPEYRELIAHADVIEADWFARTGIYPLHSTLVVKDELLQAHPWLAGAIYAAFVAAKEIYLEKLRAGVVETKDDRTYAALAKVVGDPLPYGLEENRTTIEALIKYARQQQLTNRDMTLEELFVAV